MTLEPIGDIERNQDSDFYCAKYGLPYGHPKIVEVVFCGRVLAIVDARNGGIIIYNTQSGEKCRVLLD